MKIFLDFDDTIFNTKRFKKDYIQLFLAHGISQQEFDKTYYHLDINNPLALEKYDAKEQIRKLEKLKNKELSVLENDIEEFLRDLQRYVFVDFFDFVVNFAPEDLFLVSFGKCEFLSAKIQGSGIQQYFSKVELTEGNKGQVIARLIQDYGLEKEKLCFVDDRPDQLAQVRQLHPNMLLIRMKRKECRYNDLTDDLGCPEATDLFAAREIIFAS